MTDVDVEPAAWRQTALDTDLAAGGRRPAVTTPAASPTPDQLEHDPDHQRARRLLRALGGRVVLSLVVDGPPENKRRPRVTRTGRTYQDPADRAAEAHTRAVLAPHFPTPLPGNVAVACVFYRGNRRHADVDNAIKHWLDAANGTVWVDDSQVTGVAALQELDRARPRTALAIGHHTSTLKRGGAS